MSPNEQFLRDAMAAFNREDRAAWLATVHPDARFYPTGLFPDFDSVFEGPEGFAAFWDRFHEPWDELRAEYDIIEDTGDVIAFDVRYVAQRSGARVEMPMGAVIKMRDGLGVLLVAALTTAEAREKLAGLTSTPE